MNCIKIKQYLDDYISGEVDSKIEIQINAHILRCHDCRKKIEEKEAVCNFFKNAQRFEPPKVLYQRIRDQVIRPVPRRNAIWPSWQMSLVYATATFFLGMVLMRTIDRRFVKVETGTKLEVKYEPTYKKTFSDTVLFHPAPPKNLARI